MCTTDCIILNVGGLHSTEALRLWPLTLWQPQGLCLSDLTWFNCPNDHLTVFFYLYSRKTVSTEKICQAVGLWGFKSCCWNQTPAVLKLQCGFVALDKSICQVSTCWCKCNHLQLVLQFVDLWAYSRAFESGKFPIFLKSDQTCCHERSGVIVTVSLILGLIPHTSKLVGIHRFV